MGWRRTAPNSDPGRSVSLPPLFQEGQSLRALLGWQSPSGFTKHLGIHSPLLLKRKADLTYTNCIWSLEATLWKSSSTDGTYIKKSSYTVSRLCLHADNEEDPILTAFGFQCVFISWDGSGAADH